MAIAPRLATYEDIAHYDEQVHVEILGGQIFVTPSGFPIHQYTLGALAGDLRRPAERDWWLLPKVDVFFGPHDLARPDVTGWRKENLSRLPDESPIRTRPDWICEVLSVETARRDLGSKAPVYARAGVPWYWVVDPSNASSKYCASSARPTSCTTPRVTKASRASNPSARSSSSSTRSFLP